MTELKRTYQSKVQGAALRRLAPISNQAKPEDEDELARQAGLNPVQTDQKIDLLYRLIKHLKTL
jgi:hypothetical protein